MIRTRKSPYGAPLFFSKEKDKKLGGVVEYRSLNRITKWNRSPSPRSDEMFDRLGAASEFSKLDPKTAFYHIRVESEDIKKTYFNAKYGPFEYLVMPMGICNSTATFQSVMNTIVYDCIDEHLVVYMNDLLIFSRSETEHLEHQKNIIRPLSEQNLFV